VHGAFMAALAAAYARIATTAEIVAALPEPPPPAAAMAPGSGDRSA